MNELRGISLDSFRGRRLAIFRTCDDLETIIKALDAEDGGRSTDAGVKIGVRIDDAHRNELINQVRVLKRTILLWNDGRVDPISMRDY